MPAPGNLVIYSETAVATLPLIGQGGRTAIAPIQYGQVRVNLFGPGNTPAQVYDLKGNPLSIVGGNFGQLTTDVTGQYSFQVLPGTYTIQVAATGSNTPQVTYSISIGDGGVVPLTGSQSFLLTQSVAATTWTAVHNFGTQAVDVTCYDTNWNEILPDSIQNTNTNTTVATFLVAQAGFMVVLNVGNWTPSVQNPNAIISNPSSSQSIIGDFPLTVGGSLSAKRLEGIRMADQFPGADWGAKVNAADADLGATAGEIWVNQNAGLSNATAINITNNHVLRFVQGGTYNTSAGITLNTNASMFSVLASTIINYTGSGAAVTTTGGNTISGVDITLGASATDGFLLKGTEIILENYYVSAGGASTKLLHVTAFNGTIQSGTVRISRGRCFNYIGIGIWLDHCVDTWLTDISNVGAPGNAGAIGMVIDTGVSGVYAKGVECNQGGGGGLIVKNSTPGAGAYNQWPNFLFFTDVLFDAVGLNPNFDAVLFDSSLSTSPIYATFQHLFAVGHGLQGVHISGGQGIKILGGSDIRFNGKSGVLIDSANVAHVQIADSFITGNNTSNDADSHGVYINATVANVSLLNNIMANVLDLTGFQRYGWKHGAFASLDFKAIGNSLRGNVTGPFLNNGTGTWTILDSDGSTGGTSNYIFGDLHVHGSLFMDSSAFGQTWQGNNFIATAAAPVVAAGQVGIGATTATTATAGANGAVPAQVVGYLIINVAGTNVKVPYFAV